MPQQPSNRVGRRRTALRPRLPGRRREALRTTLWLVPSLLTAAAVALFVVTYEVDHLLYQHHVVLPHWIESGTGDSGRQVLIAIAAAVITVVGVVFSITILALTLASQQFGPRMMRNFVRNTGNQVTLGVWVGTFVYSLLVLAAIGGTFVPHLSITVAGMLLLVDVAVLIYFINHIAKTIQLPEVIAGIASDLFRAIDTEFPMPAGTLVQAPDGGEEEPSVEELLVLLDDGGLAIPSSESGYLQFVAYRQLISIAEDANAVIRLTHRPGHFLVEGLPLATVWPPDAAPLVATALARAHVTGPHRTLTQDPVFAIDQLVEIAIRALSAAVNDTFTALTCIDWLSAGLCRMSERALTEGVYRDRSGRIRLIELDPSYARMVNRAFDKVRQAARGMPAVIIRLMDAIGHVMDYTATPAQRKVLLRQAEMIMRAAEGDVDEQLDREDIRRRYEHVVAAKLRLDDGAATPPSRWQPDTTGTEKADGRRRVRVPWRS